MKTRNLGKSGLVVSTVGLGCNNFGMGIDLAAMRAVIHKALDLGVTPLDTADIYLNCGPSEAILGQVLGNRRHRIVLATKVGKEMDAAGLMKGASRRYILSEVEASLGRLNTDYIDLYQIHSPDPLTPMEETLRTLDDLIRQRVKCAMRDARTFLRGRSWKPIGFAANLELTGSFPARMSTDF